jgi:hypothetical protein
MDRLIATLLLEAKNAPPETVEGSVAPKAARLHEP